MLDSQELHIIKTLSNTIKITTKIFNLPKFIQAGILNLSELGSFLWAEWLLAVLLGLYHEVWDCGESEEWCPDVILRRWTLLSWQSAGIIFIIFTRHCGIEFTNQKPSGSGGSDPLLSNTGWRDVPVWAGQLMRHELLRRAQMWISNKIWG